MMKKNKYEPEDIEKLLRNKSFDSLLEEEREFILNHIESENEYRNMRSVLLQVEDNSWDDIPDLDPSLRHNLIKKHRDHHRKSIRVWLNTFFGISTNKPDWYGRPKFQLAFATVLFIGVIFTFRNVVKPDKNLAETNIEHVENLPPRIIEENALGDRSSQLPELKKVDRPDSEKELDENIAQSDTNENHTFAYTNLVMDNNVADNIESNDDAQDGPTLDIEKLAANFDKNEGAVDREASKQIDDLDEDYYLFMDDAITQNDSTELQFSNNNNNNNGSEDLLSIQPIVSAEATNENESSNNDFEDNAMDNIESNDLAEEEISELNVASRSRSVAWLEKKELKNDKVIPKGISLAENPGIINQLFTAY